MDKVKKYQSEKYILNIYENTWYDHIFFFFSFALSITYAS